MSTGIPRVSVKNPSTPIEGLSNWAVLFGPATEDVDGQIENPYDLDVFSVEDGAALSVTPYSFPTSEGGRILILGQHSGRLEVWPLFTADGASANVQLFQFTAVDRHYADSEAQLRLTAPEVVDLTVTDLDALERPGLCLGPAYPMGRDAEDDPYIVMTCNDAETHDISVNNGIAYEDTDVGATYASGTRHIFDCAGAYAILAWVPEVTDGEFLLLARSI